MGTIFSQGQITGSPELTEEVEASLNQILHAFHHEFPLHSKRHHHNQATLHSSNAQTEELIRHSHRSRSLDRYESEEHQPVPKAKSSVIKRQWQCQLCHSKNESDSQICSECGSNKINVYIPVMDRIERNKNHPQNLSDSSA
jgi:hypothetical protein